MKKLIVFIFITTGLFATVPYWGIGGSISGNNNINAECRAAVMAKLGTTITNDLSVELRGYISPNPDYKSYAGLFKYNIDKVYVLVGYGYTDSVGGSFSGLNAGGGIEFDLFFVDVIYREKESNVVGTIGIKYNF